MRTAHRLSSGAKLRVEDYGVPARQERLHLEHRHGSSAQ
jgi:hypothetical protein